jgi:MoaA/NifB/PqqE/SkfB family radical SAM enzyme
MTFEGASTLDYDDLIASAARAVDRSQDTHLAPAMRRANKARGFDSSGGVRALQAWIAQRTGEDDRFDAIKFLHAYLNRNPQNVVALVALALEFKTLGDKEQSLATITAALAVHRFDLYAAEVAHSIFAWSKGDTSDDVSEWLKGRYCAMPFSNFDTMPNGDVFMCCGDWLPVPIGNIHESTAEEIWNSPVANEIRASIVDGSFRYCNRLSCMHIINRDLPPAVTKPPPINGTVNPPSRIVLSHDNSCNLSCPSCRSELILAKKEHQDRLNGLLDAVFLPLLRSAKAVRISGSGDPFASHHYRTLLKSINRKEFPNLNVDLHTNAQLFDERAWEELQLAGKIRSVEISIDAATSATYRIVRRGGSFDRLLRNLVFIKALRRKREIGSLIFSFVVQQQNYREMPEFVLLAEKFGADFIDFRMIQNWGVCSLTEFKRKFIGAPDHPEYLEYLKILRRPELKKTKVRVPSVCAPRSPSLWSAMANGKRLLRRGRDLLMSRTRRH